jgi:hypothetical protein
MFNRLLDTVWLLRVCGRIPPLGEEDEAEPEPELTAETEKS